MENEKIRKIGISVIIPTYNRPDYLDRLLCSILKQTRKVDEIIVVNDCSVNMKEYEQVIGKYNRDIEIRHIVNSKNMGAPCCRNIGIEVSRFTYLALTDDDDEWLPQKIEKQFELMKSNEYGLIYTHGIAVDKNGKEIYQFTGNGCGHDIKALLIEDFIPSSSVMVSYEAIVLAGMFDKRFPSCQDWDMWVRIIAAGYAYEVVKERLLIYHKHEGDSIGSSPKAKLGYKLFYRKHIKKYLQMFLFGPDYKICLHAIKKVIF